MFIRDYLAEHYPDDVVAGGLRVTTTLDYTLQHSIPAGSTGTCGAGKFMKSAGNPFTDAPNGDFNIANQTLVANGADLTSTCASWTPPCNVDINGTARPSGSAWDRGAFQIVTGGATPAASLNTVSVAFGRLEVGLATNPTSTITIQNSGETGSTLTITAIALTTGTSFSITGGTCGASPVSLTYLQSCTVIVKGSPALKGAVSDTLSFTNNASTSPQTVAFTATGFSVPIKGKFNINGNTKIQ